MLLMIILPLLMVHILSLTNHLMIKSAGKIIYDTNNLHKITFVKNLLEFSDDYSRSVATKN